MAARSTIPASALPGPQMPVPMQLYKYRTLRTDWLMQLRQQYGHRFRLNIRPKMNIYVLSDPEDVKQMFLAPRDKLHTGNGSAVLQKFMGNTGLAFLDEGEHLARRKSLLPAFKGDAFRRIQDSIDERARRAITTWPRNHVASLHPFAHRYTTEVIREVIFGSFVPSCWDELRDEVLGTMDFNTHAATFFLLHKMKRLTVRALEAFRPTGLHDFLRHRERADALIAQAVRERMEHGELGDDMLSVMLGIKHDDGTPLSAVELRDEMMTMFVAGTETTAAAICWSLEMLSRTPAVRDRLIAEIDEGTDDAYLTATVHEVLRLRPPLPNIILREVMKPIEIGGVRYEPGDQLWASAYLLNRDAERYEEPEEFRPERFLNIKPGTYTWIPFGGGHIRCLGDRIGIHEVKAMLREVLSTCELHRADPTPEGTRSRGVVIVPEHGARLELRPRQPEAALADR
ncbi:cytochrome P450 [Streptomyces sp. JJ38]|uniref:cytochrome P450 n=1 Tax=Streptomyces sp. JJ38 TaxID=2738128 RepID=UPI001C55B80D|nr:cytochrome P450 [Streptomyces sp. JJ38]MBW1599887.1 cytochrome P450 [Streptomyces sp. JJ38]